MDKSPTAHRPQQVTIAGWVGAGASLAMVLSAFSWMSRLTSVEVRDSLRTYLTSGAGKAFGIDLHQALVVARIGLFVTGAAAAAMLVLAVFALRRERSSRVWMSALALPIGLFGVFVDPFLAGFILCAVVLLWTRPATDWFLGRSPGPAASTAYGAFGHPPRELPPQLPPLASPPGEHPARLDYAPPGPDDRVDQPARPMAPERPMSVLLGCAIGSFFSSLTAVLLGIGVAALPSMARADQIRAELEKQPALQQAGITLDQLIVLMQVLVALAAVWALAAAGIALVASRGRAWARIVLTVSSGAAGLLSLLMAISLPPLLLVTVACVAVPVLLFRPDASRWYAAQKRSLHGPAYRPERPW